MEAQSQEHDVDAIIANAYGTQNPSNESIPETQRPAVEQIAEPQYKEFEFNHRGQQVKIKENDPRHTQWLQQGYDYAQQTKAFKDERETWEKSKGEWEQNWGRYREIDDFAKQNPAWWNKIDHNYQEQQAAPPQGVSPEVKSYLDQTLQPIAQDIPLMKQFLQEMQTQKMEAARSEQDARLEKSIKSIQEKYPDLDFSTKDSTGYSLEQRVLNHAVENGFPTFRASFLDYYHDNLEKVAEARGRESTMKEMQKRQKLGLLDENPAQSKGEMTFGNGAKPRSWNDPALSAEAILREFKFA